MERSRKPLPLAIIVAVIVLATIRAFKSFVQIMYWWDHHNPVYATEHALIAWLCAVVAGGLIVALARSADRPGNAVARFFDGGTGLWPTAFGLLILGGGLYGLLVVANYDDYDWVFYSAEGGVGFAILKRTFTLNR